MSDSPPSEAQTYEIRLSGHLDERCGESFPGLAFTHCVSRDGTPLTILRGPVVDDAALHGLIARIRDLGIPLLLVRRTSDGVHDSSADSPETHTSK